MNKTSGGDGIPVELFQILKDDAVKVLHSTCQQIWKTQQWPEDWKISVFIPIPKKGNDKECSNCGSNWLTNQFHSLYDSSQTGSSLRVFMSSKLYSFLTAPFSSSIAGVQNTKIKVMGVFTYEICVLTLLAPNFTAKETQIHF